MTREEVAFEIAAEIASSKFELTGEKADYDEEQRCDQGLRTALAILTEGVVAAPLEGISQVKIKNNPDSSKYIAAERTVGSFRQTRLWVSLSFLHGFCVG